MSSTINWKMKCLDWQYTNYKIQLAYAVVRKLQVWFIWEHFSGNWLTCHWCVIKKLLTAHRQVRMVHASHWTNIHIHSYYNEVLVTRISYRTSKYICTTLMTNYNVATWFLTAHECSWEQIMSTVLSTHAVHCMQAAMQSFLAIRLSGDIYESAYDT